MITRAHSPKVFWILPLVFFATLPLPAGYKARPWSPRPIESYAAKLTSEGVTIAVEPFFTDALAGQVFDKKDMVARGIMPLAVIIFNSNSFPIAVKSSGSELIHETAHIRALEPEQALMRAYQENPKASRSPIPGRAGKIEFPSSQEDLLRDYLQKYLGIKEIEPHATAGGFLYLPVDDPSNLRAYLAAARIYLPNIVRADTGAGMIFFEIELKAAVDAIPPK